MERGPKFMEECSGARSSTRRAAWASSTAVPHQRALSESVWRDHPLIKEDRPRWSRSIPMRAVERKRARKSRCRHDVVRCSVDAFSRENLRAARPGVDYERSCATSKLMELRTAGTPSPRRSAVIDMRRIGTSTPLISTTGGRVARSDRAAYAGPGKAREARHEAVLKILDEMSSTPTARRRVLLGQRRSRPDRRCQEAERPRDLERTGVGGHARLARSRPPRPHLVVFALRCLRRRPVRGVRRAGTGTRRRRVQNASGRGSPRPRNAHGDTRPAARLSGD